MATDQGVSDKISEIELINVARKMGPHYYRTLGNNLGFGQAELDNILLSSHQNVQEAIHTILRRWNDDRPMSENSREVLSGILDDTELKAIGDLLRVAHASLLQGSSQRSTTPQSTPVTSITSPVDTSASTSPQSSIDSTVNQLAGLFSRLLPRNMQLPQHHSHVYNASSETVKVVLTTSRNEQVTDVLQRTQYCRIPTPYGRVRLAVYRKSADGRGGFAHDPCARFADDSDRSFIVKKSSDGNNLVVVRSVYGKFRTEER